MARRPVPVPDERSQPFWDATARGELRVPRCSRCSTLAFPPEPTCPNCGTGEPAWDFQLMSGRGTIRSWTVVRQAFLPDLEAPYVLVDVEVAEDSGLRMIGQLVGGFEADPRLGAVVMTEFDQIAEGISVPVFRLVDKS